MWFSNTSISYEVFCILDYYIWHPVGIGQTTKTNITIIYDCQMVMIHLRSKYLHMSSSFVLAISSEIERVQEFFFFSSFFFKINN